MKPHHLVIFSIILLGIASFLFWDSCLLKCAFSQTNSKANPKNQETDKNSVPQGNEINSPAPKKSSGKEANFTISSPKIKEISSKLFLTIPKGKTIAFAEFTDADGKMTQSSQSIFLQIEPIIIAEGNKAGLAFIERKDLKLILDEWDLNAVYKTEGVDPGAQALLGADYILTGKALATEDNIICTLKLIDLQSGKITNTASGKANPSKETKVVAPPVTVTPPVNDKISSNKSVSEDAKLSIWTSKRTYNIGDKIEVFFSVTDHLYVEIMDITPDGEINKIFPNEQQQDNYCLPGKTYRIPPENSDIELLVTPPAGVDRIKAIASPTVIGESLSTKTRGIQFTKSLVQSTPIRANISVVIEK